MSKADQLSKSALMQFTGSENWYRHGLNRAVLFTDGAKHVADAGGAYWLLDEIAIAQGLQPEIKGEEFQVWKLAVALASHSATLTCEDGNDNVVFSKVIEFTDFPVESITLWFTNNTILLPSEY
jgi:hypothetical protein